MKTVKVRYLPELTEEEAMRIFKKHLEVGGARRGKRRTTRTEEEDQERQDGDIYHLFEVYKPTDPEFKGFVVEDTVAGGDECLERVRMRVVLVQEKDTTSFNLEGYEPSKAKAVWEGFKSTANAMAGCMLFILSMLSSDSRRHGSHDDDSWEPTGYEAAVSRLEDKVASIISDAPEFKDPKAKRGCCGVAGTALILAAPLLVIAVLALILVAPFRRPE